MHAYLHQLHCPLTIPGGYYSRDCARWAEGSVRSPTWFHPSGGSSPVHPVPAFACHFRPASHSRGGGPLQGAPGAEPIEDREAACRLRFKVFNIELGEGLAELLSEPAWIRIDFDLFCEHLLVEDKLESNPARRIVGTYRMQSGTTAAHNLGYYSEQEFNFAPYEPLRPGILELGRASIDREHRTPEVLTLLWRGIAQYATDMGLRYLDRLLVAELQGPG